MKTLEEWREYLGTAEDTGPHTATREDLLDLLLTAEVLASEKEGLLRAERIVRQERDASIEREKKTREQFADLKERLHNAEIENARLGGYLERVEEDDQVRDGVFEIKESDGTHVRPKRPPRMRAINRGSYDGVVECAGNGYGERRQKRVHWTSY